jgi:hypothetical protein
MKFFKNLCLKLIFLKRWISNNVKKPQKLFFAGWLACYSAFMGALRSPALLDQE